MKIINKPHLLIRLAERKIPKIYIKKLLQNPELKYFDSLTNHYVAVKKLPYVGRERLMVAVYDIIEGEKEVITIYPSSDSEIKNKVNSGRWKKYEKD